MKKIMEVYADVSKEKDHTSVAIVVKSFERHYHIFGGVSIDEDIKSFNIIDKTDAAKFMLKFFENLELEERKTISETDAYPIVQISFKLKEK